MQTKEILNSFYKAFAQGNTEQMLSHYHPEATFKDPAFGELSEEEVKAMWTMLMERAKGNLKIEHEILEANETSGKVLWQAKYVYGKNKRPVHNKIKANIQIKDGLIIRHVDEFNLWKWSKQALGMSGLLLGWSSFLKNKIQSGAKISLAKFMNQHR